MTIGEGMEEGDKDFLRRWSRLKAESRQAAVEPKREGVPSKPAEAAPEADSTATPLPTLDSLQGMASEYREFLRPGVDEPTRRAALKKLFDDPHFNTMDGLDVYIDDYTREDPIPEQMLRALNQAKGLIFDAEEAGDKPSEPTADGKAENAVGLSDPEAPMPQPASREAISDAETIPDELPSGSPE